MQHHRERTFASLKTFKPGVVKSGVTVVATVVEPSSTRSAAAEFAGFLENSALSTH